MKKYLISLLILIFLFYAKPLFAEEMEIFANDVLHSIFNQIAEIEKDYPALSGFALQAKINSFKTGNDKEYVLEFKKNVAGFDKSNPQGVLKDKNGCFISVRIQNIRQGQQSYGSDAVSLSTNHSLDLEVITEINVKSKELSDKLSEIIHTSIRPLLDYKVKK